MKLIICLMTTLLLAACATQKLPIRPIHMDFTSLPTINLSTSDIRIIDRSQLTTHQKPYIGHFFTPTVNKTIHKMIKQRLRTTGKTGHATFIIKDANIIARTLKTSGKLFTREQAWKYSGRIEVSLEAQSPIQGSSAVITAIAEHNITLPEDPTTYEKQEAYRTLLTALMARLNKNLDKGIQKHMVSFMANTMPLAPQILPTTATTTDSILQITPRTLGM